LLARQDLVELGLRLLLKFGDLLYLIVGQVQLIGHEAREQVEPGRTSRSTATAWPTRTAGSAAVRTATTLTALAWRTIRGALLCGGSHGKGGKREDAEDR
jgi:hypothetical protein